MELYTIYIETNFYIYEFELIMINDRIFLCIKQQIIIRYYLMFHDILK